MDNQQIGLALSLKAAGIPVSTAKFDDRLIVQKTVYLLQQAGVELGYSFRWYLRGPYSPAAADDLFTLASTQHRLTELKEWKMDEASKQRIEKLKPLLVPIHSKSVAWWVELLASVLFLVRTRQSSVDDMAGLAGILKKYGKPYGQTEVAEAIKALKEHGFSFS